MKMKVLFICLLIFMLQANDVMGMTDKSRNDAVVKAVQYILSHRQPDYGWEDFTPRALIALSFVSKDFGIPLREKRAMMDSLGNKLLNLLHEGVDNVPLQSLAMNINALFATCEDPYNFHSINLVEWLRFQTDKKGAMNMPVVYLSLCLGKETRREDYDMLIQMYDDNSNHKLGIKALTLIALAACDQLASTQHHYETLSRVEDFVNRFKITDDLGAYSRALIYQVYNAWNYNATSLRDTLRHLQDDEGSFGGLLGTYAAIPALLETSLAKLKCQRNYKVKPKQKLVDHSPALKSKSLIQYHLEIPYGENIGVHMLPLLFEGRMSFYQLMKVAQQKNNLYRFSVEEFEGIGKKVSNLAGIENDDESGLNWVLYRKNANKDFAEENGGLEYLFPLDGDVLVFKLEKNT